MKIKVIILFIALGLTMGISYLGLKMNRDHQRSIGKEIGRLYEEGLVSTEVRTVLEQAKDTAKLNYKVILWPTLISWLIAVVMATIIVRDHFLAAQRGSAATGSPQ